MTAALLRRAADRADGSSPSAPPQQLGFLDDAPAAPPLRVAVIGRLMRRPEVLALTGGRSAIAVQVLQSDAGLPFVAMLPGDRRELEHLAAQLGDDAAVLLRGVGLRLADWRGAQVLQLIECDSVSAAPPGAYAQGARA